MKKTIAILAILLITMLAAHSLQAATINVPHIEPVITAAQQIESSDRQPWRKAQNKVNKRNIRSWNKTSKQIRRMNKKSQNQRRNG